MENIIEIELNNENDLFEKYSKKIISNDLIKYILDQLLLIESSSKVKFIIYNNFNTDKDILHLIKNGLIKEYKIREKRHYLSNLKQTVLLLIGILFLLLSTFISENFVFKEVFLIVGWVPIWEVVDIKLFVEVKEKKILRELKKIQNSSFEIKNKS